MKHWMTICATWVLTFAPAVSLSRPPEAKPPIAIEASGLEQTGGHWYLDMRVWNCADKALTLDISDLPWGGLLGHSFLIYHVPSTKTMQPIYPIEDLPEIPYVIPPKGFIAGQVDLSRYFPDLAKVKAPELWVVFWVYQSTHAGDWPTGKKWGGMVPLNEKPAKPSNSPCKTVQAN